MYITTNITTFHIKFLDSTLFSIFLHKDSQDCVDYLQIVWDKDVKSFWLHPRSLNWSEPHIFQIFFCLHYYIMFSFCKHYLLRERTYCQQLHFLLSHSPPCKDIWKYKTDLQQHFTTKCCTSYKWDEHNI